jgi:hypothetical protein
MALLEDNCYVTLAEANAYFNNRVQSSTWHTTDSDVKEKALITATSLLDELQWTGIAVSEDQTLAFPRSGSYFDPRLGYEIVLDDETIPNQIKIATYELALHLLSNEGILDSTGSITELSVGPINLKSISVPSTIPLSVKRKIKPLLVNGGSRSWWRAW